MKQVAGIWLPDDDTHFASHLENSELFEGKGTYQYSKIKACLGCVPGMLKGNAIDIGAHVGLWSRILVRNFWHVYAFEPMGELVECFERNATSPYVTVYQTALGSKCQPPLIAMQYSKDNSGNSCVAPDQNGVPYMVPAAALDDFDIRNVSFIKIDTEGYELQVLLGAVDTIRRERPVVLVEQKPGNAERYDCGQFDAIRYLEREFGMVELWHKSGDYCYGWKS